MAYSIARSVHIRRKPAEVAAVVTRMEELGKYLVGFSRFESVGSKRNQIGAEYEVYLDIGTIQVGGRVAITDLDESGRLGWTSKRGTRHSFALKTELDGDGSRITISLSYELAGRLLARISERIGGTILARNMEASAEKLRHHLEFELD